MERRKKDLKSARNSNTQPRQSRLHLKKTKKPKKIEEAKKSFKVLKKTSHNLATGKLIKNVNKNNSEDNLQSEDLIEESVVIQIPRVSNISHHHLFQRLSMQPIIIQEDIDNMSYDQLLNLGEAIGKVSKGLTAEEINV